MAGHVPRFDSPNAGGFTETFATARPGGRGGSGREPQRGSKADDTATTNNPPAARRQPQRNRSGGAPAPAPEAASAPGPAPARRPTRTKPAPPSDGDSHIPTFGTWDVDADQNYTGIFQAASKARKGEAGVPAPEPASGRKSDGDLYKAHSKKRSSSWCCFGA